MKFVRKHQVYKVHHNWVSLMPVLAHIVFYFQNFVLLTSLLLLKMKKKNQYWFNVKVMDGVDKLTIIFLTKACPFHIHYILFLNSTFQSTQRSLIFRGKIFPHIVRNTVIECFTFNWIFSKINNFKTSKNSKYCYQLALTN